jgi:nonsense-mediated mRNA decay protein 3
MSAKRSYSSMTVSSVARFADVLCCVCGTTMQPSPSNMCSDCLRGEVDIAQGICRSATIDFCRECERYQRPPWVHCELESRELLSICLKKVTGLTSEVKLVDAGFIWTEPHSRRLKVRLTVQKVVAQGTIMQQNVVVEFIVHAMQCDDCKKTYTPHTWCSVVQLRQKADHKRTFYFLEQLILKHSAHEQVVGIKTVKDGLDFQFAHRSHSQKFADFVQGLVPARTRLSKHLISHDPNNNTYNYKYTIHCEMCPVCKDDLVYLPSNVRSKLGGFPSVALVTKVTTAIHLVDPVTGRTAQIQGTEYWKYPFESVCTRKNLSDFTVLDVESRSGVVSNVEIARTIDLGVNDDRLVVRTQLGDQLKAGDLIHCYDLTRINFSGPNEEGIEQSLRDIDIIIVKKTWASKKNKRRNWVLKRLKKEKAEDMDDEKEDRDFEEFHMDLATNPDMRREINIYKRSDKNLAPIHEEDSGSEPDIDLAELLDEMTLNENEEA